MIGVSVVGWRGGDARGVCVCVCVCVVVVVCGGGSCVCLFRSCAE